MYLYTPIGTWPALALVFYLLLSGQAATFEAGGKKQNQRSFVVAKVVLGMNLENVLNIYPTAIIEKQEINCYSYGRAIRVPALTRQTLRIRNEEDILTLDFEPSGIGGRLYRVHYDRAIDLTENGVVELVDRFAKQHGRYDRILHRRKMEPAGRIVGFEWQNVTGDTLRIELRQEYNDGKAQMRLSTLVKSFSSVTRTAPGACSFRTRDAD